MPLRTHPSTTRRQLIAGLGGLAVASVPGLARAAPGPAPRLRRGIGLHDLLNWPETTGQGAALRYDWPPFQGPEHQIAGAELAALKRAGFDFARLTVDPSIFIVTGADRRPVLEKHALGVVHRLLDAGLSVMVDLHPVGVNPAYGPEALIDPGKPDVFAAYVDMVGRVAAMLRGLPDDRVVLELFNEPWIGSLREAPRWQAMLERLHASARAADPSRALVLNGLQWDSAAGLLAVDTRPFANSNVLYTFHYYEPHAFTHQGVQADTRWLHGLRWPENDSNVQATLGRALAAIAADPKAGSGASRASAEHDTRNYAAQLLRERPGHAQIEQDFASVSRWASAHAIPPERVVLGEFGCAADPGSDPGDRLAWLASVRTACERAGFGWAYWAYKGKSGMTLTDEGGTLDADTLASLGLPPRG